VAPKRKIAYTGPEMKISACVICFNEEKAIRECLESVRWMDEIVVVDSRSSDGTVAIAREYTDRVIVRDWPGHREQKSFAISEARNEWVFSIDADERVSPALRSEIERIVREGPGEAHGFSMPRLTRHLGRWIRHGGWYPDRKIRLFLRERVRVEGENPHDRFAVDGKVTDLTGDLLHYSYEDFAHQIRTINSFSTIAAQELFRKGRRGVLLPLLCRPFVKFLETYVYKLGFLDGFPGLAISLSTAYLVVARYIKLWEMTRGEGREPGEEDRKT
jgi:glycosyltransferase involved in cell wall biosynthesis